MEVPKACRAPPVLCAMTCREPQYKKYTWYMCANFRNQHVTNLPAGPWTVHDAVDSAAHGG